MFATTNTFTPVFPGQLVNPDGKKRGLETATRQRLNRKISNLTRHFHEMIPIDALFAILGEEHIKAIQEDGAEWSGFLCGGAEVGTEEARKQVVSFPLALDRDAAAVACALAGGAAREEGYTMLREGLQLSWGKMPVSGKYEVVAYVL